MRLTTRGRYAVTAILDVAMYEKKKPVTLVDISKRQGISLSYLEQLFSIMRRAGLVKSVKGPGGGYLLARSSCDIYLSQIIDSVKEVIDSTKCKGGANCRQGAQCLTHQLWTDLSNHIHQFFMKISIKDLLLKSEIQKVAMENQEEVINNLLITNSTF